MKRTTAFAGLILALPILIAGCGGGTDSERQALQDELRTELIDGGATEEQANCVMGGIDDLSTDELKSLQGEDAPPQELQDKVFAVLEECAFGG